MRYLAVLFSVLILHAADVPDSKDPVGMKRYEGSEMIGYHAPNFQEYVVPLSPPQGVYPAVYKKASRWKGCLADTAMSRRLDGPLPSYSGITGWSFNAWA
ncbi:MAG: hypothetical protein ABJF23_01245 [Bryobacteraceae bacterium]